jgi:hypothetical protein
MMDELPDLEGVTPLFVWDYWDLPLSGICKYRDETLFFTIARDSEDDTPPRYTVYRLPKEQTAYFVLEKAEFERLVGTSGSYAEDQPFRRIGGWSGRSDWRSFYDRPKRFKLEDELKRDTAELVGHFSWGPPTHSKDILPH